MGCWIKPKPSGIFPGVFSLVGQHGESVGSERDHFLWKVCTSNDTAQRNSQPPHPSRLSPCSQATRGARSLLLQCQTASPFSRFVRDVSSTECHVLQAHLADPCRDATHLANLGIPLEIRATSVGWTVETSLMHLQTAVDDMGPKQLAG